MNNVFKHSFPSSVWNRLFQLGDTKESNKIAGVMSASANCPCRSCHATVAQISDPHLDVTEIARTHAQAAQQRREIQDPSISQSQRQAIKSRYGIHAEKPAFGNLLMFNFLQFPFDITHSEALGTFRVLFFTLVEVLSPTYGFPVLDKCISTLANLVGLTLQPVKGAAKWTATQFRVMACYSAVIFPTLIAYDRAFKSPFEWTRSRFVKAFLAASRWVRIVWAKKLPFLEMSQMIDDAAVELRTALLELSQAFQSTPNIHYGLHLYLQSVWLGIPLNADLSRCEALHLGPGGKKLTHNYHNIAMRIMTAANDRESMVHAVAAAQAAERGQPADLGAGFFLGSAVVDAIQTDATIQALAELRATKHDSGWSLIRNSTGVVFRDGDNDRVGWVNERAGDFLNVCLLDRIDQKESWKQYGFEVWQRGECRTINTSVVLEPLFLGVFVPVGAEPVYLDSSLVLKCL